MSRATPVLVESECRSYLERFSRTIAARTDELLLDLNSSKDYQIRRWTAPLPDVPLAPFVVDGGGFRTLPFDLDSKHGDPSRDLDQLKGLLGDVGIKPATFASGPGGGIHALATFDQRVPAEIVRSLGAGLCARLPTLDFCPLANPSHSAIRSPFSRHAHGGRSMPFGDPDLALATLGQANPLQAVYRLLEVVGLPEADRVAEDDLAGSLRLPRRALTVATRRLLVEGDVHHRYATESELIEGIANGFFDVGHSFEEYLEALYESTNRGGLRTRRLHSEQSAQAAVRDAERAWARAVENVSRRPPIAGPEDVRRRADALRRSFDEDPLDGPTGPQDEVILMGWWTEAAEFGNLRLSSGDRRIANRLGYRREQVGACRRRRPAWFRTVQRGGKGEADTFELRIPNSRHLQLTGPIEERAGSGATLDSLGGKGDGDLLDPGANCWTTPGLGPRCYRIWRHLRMAGERTVEEIALRERHKASHVLRHFTDMAGVGIVAERDGLWCAYDRHPDDVAADLDLLNVKARRRETHDRQSANFRDWCDAPPGFPGPVLVRCLGGSYRTTFGLNGRTPEEFAASIPGGVLIFAG